MTCPACGYDNLAGADECAHCFESLTQEDVPQPTTPLEATIMDDPIASLKLADPVSVELGTPVGRAVARMQERNIGCVIILDRGKLAGILTEHDLLCKIVGQSIDLEATPVDSFMTPNPSSLKSSDPLNQALHLMAIQGYHYIPVVDDAGRATGIFSFRRIAEMIEATVEAEYARMRDDE